MDSPWDAVGAGTGALLGGFKFKDLLRIGIGMMARAEVLIVTTQTGIDAGLVSPSIMPFALILIVVTSFLTPILLKLLYRDKGGSKVDSVKEIESPVSGTAAE